MRTRAVLALLAALWLVALATVSAQADEAWVITSFHSDIRIATDSSVSISEDIRVDFGSLQKHGIFRTIPTRYRYDDTHDRYYDLTVRSVTDGSRPVPYTTSVVEDNEVIKIGDANLTVSGAQRYVIAYKVVGAMNSFGDHDELVWNVDGGLIVRFWLRHGRDRAYLTRYYQTNEAAPDRLEPVFQHEPVVVEFEPPQNLRPAELGLILDETADTKDVTATIVDLAVRGFLTITEVPGKRDWMLTQKSDDVANLLPYERTLYNGLFGSRQQVKISELKGTFHSSLNSAESEVYADAMSRKFFRARPDMVRLATVGVAILIALFGVGLTFVLGITFGGGLIGVAVILVGVVLAVMNRAMASRTASGRGVMQKTLGSRLYMTTAEKSRQPFAEKTATFTQPP